VSPEDSFRRIVTALDRVGIPYMLTGSLACSYHGSPRSTQDIDIVIAPTSEQLHALVKQLPEPEHYVNLDTALEALQSETQFNVVDLSTGWKIDFIIRKSRQFSRAEFDRRAAVEFLGLRVFVASAEDIVLSKLEWARLGQSQRQVEDVSRLLMMRWDSLDLDYLRRWVSTLGLEEQWRDACLRAGVAGAKDA